MKARSLYRHVRGTKSDVAEICCLALLKWDLLLVGLCRRLGRTGPVGAVSQPPASGSTTIGPVDNPIQRLLETLTSIMHMRKRGTQVIVSKGRRAEATLI